MEWNNHLSFWKTTKCLLERNNSAPIEKSRDNLLWAASLHELIIHFFVCGSIWSLWKCFGSLHMSGVLIMFQSSDKPFNFKMNSMCFERFIFVQWFNRFVRFCFPFQNLLLLSLTKQYYDRKLRAQKTILIPVDYLWFMINKNV